MKKLIFSFALCLLLSSAATAQVTFGLKAGGMLSNTALVEPDSLSGSGDAKISYLLGGFMNVPINDKFSIQPELLYANKGGKDFYQHYINLPVMLQYNLTDKFKLEAGPEISYLLASYSQWYDLNGNRSNRYRQHFTKDFDISINVGVSYALLDRLNIGLRYNMGIVDTYAPEKARFGFGSTIERPEYNIKNRTLQLSVGWKLGKK
ncbi:porin family protein [Catalinimonas niigatensis]|uniref:porin family protein n=1 Tax=Catalinimonas niigatensis TaxID=1397264 RepID=UPI0026661DC2|nr:porin family protein [Catalinimonas niigatensis]WPP53444.1 porin family protein [Catalinimonas niigatensis]